MANNQLLASDNFASGSLAAGWSAAFGSTLSSVTASAPYYAEPPNTATVCDNAWTGLTWPNNQISEITVQSLVNAASTNVALWTRIQSGSLSGYVANFSNNVASATIYRCDSGSFTELAQVAVSVVSGDVLAFQASGAILTVYQNGNRLLWTADATYTAGSVGFRQNSSTAIVDSQVASWRGYSAVQQDGIWTKQGTVIPALAGDIGAGALGVYQLSNIFFEGNAQILSGNVFKGWFSAGASPGSIYYAESTDGITWTRLDAAVLADFANPFLIKNGATYYMYVQPAASQGSADFALYTSADGINWAQQSTTILAPGGAGAWDETDFFDFQPVAIIAGTWYALYTGGASGGATLSTGLATSPDGLNWTKYAGNPVLPGIVNNGAIAQIGNAWYLWAAANQPNQFSGTLNGFRPFEIVRYKTLDFINWTNATHSAHRTQMFESLNYSLAGCGGAFPNAIINVGGKAYLYIQENPADGVTPDIQQISLAVAPVSISSVVTQNEDAVVQTASDSFTSGTGNLSPNWTTPTGAQSAQIVAGNLVEPTNAGAAGVEVYTGASFNASQYSEITVAALNHTTPLIAPLVRAATAAQTWYQAQISAAVGALGTAAIYVTVAGASTQLGPSVGVTPQVGDVFRLSVITGSDGFPVLSLFQNGFILLQVQDPNNLITSGNPGFYVFNATANGDTQINLWAGGNANMIPSYPSGASSSWLTVALANSLRGLRH